MPAGGLCGSRLPASFLVDGEAAINVASTIVPPRSNAPRASRYSATASNTVFVSSCASSSCYCLQQFYNLSDPGAEEALYDIQSMRAFCNLELGRDPIPDETTILNFRHLLEAHELTKTVFEAVAEHLEARGALLRGGTIVDATLIAASPSTKNEAGKRDPQ